jgi:DNA-binding LacI/PurR family transcriptional regulator
LRALPIIKSAVYIVVAAVKPITILTKRPPSLENIAAKAGVSRSTVSRALGVSEKTRQRGSEIIAPQAIFFYPPSDLFARQVTAHGALPALHETHIQVPAEIALTGFDDFPTASQIGPQLTILLDLIENPGSGPHPMTLPTQLIVRESRGSV